MDEFISRKMLREAFDNADADIVEEYEDGDCDWGFGRQNILEVINSVPSADVAPVRHGRWLFVKAGQCTSAWCCSECGRSVAITCDEELRQSKLEKEYPFCHCGAKMDGGFDNG